MINRLKSLRLDHIILVVVASVIAIEGAFILWSLYDVRDDVKVSKRELLALRGYATTNQKLTTATNKLLEAANMELLLARQKADLSEERLERIELYTLRSSSDLDFSARTLNSIASQLRTNGGELQSIDYNTERTARFTGNTADHTWSLQFE